MTSTTHQSGATPVTHTPGASYRIPRDLKERMRRAAAQHGVTMTDIVVRGIELALAELEQDDSNVDS